MESPSRPTDGKSPAAKSAIDDDEPTEGVRIVPTR
jgi:hypothetical protein